MNPREAFWGIFELASFVTTFVILGILNWHYICFLLPFYYFGHCLSYLNGYYRHCGGNPDEPIAWGVSTYSKLYNWTWFFNGYHAETSFPAESALDANSGLSRPEFWSNSARLGCA